MFDHTRVFGIAPGVDFPAELVAGLRARITTPQDMARVTLFVNTARMRRRITDIFTAGGPCLLPKLRLITDLDALADLPAAISPLRRRLELAKVIAALLDAEPNLAPRNAVFDLAESLADLLDEMQGEGVPPQAIADLDVSKHSEHWEKSQKFLKIISPLFADGLGGEARRRAAVQQIAALWQDQPDPGPVIVAGSTGSRGTTALFMQAVARLPQGALVLPGYDTDLPPHVWAQMDDVLTAEDHPQFRFRRLLDGLGLTPQDVGEWTKTPAPAPDRNRLISLSLRPAPITDQWLTEGPSLPDLITATQGITLVESATQRAEAGAIALILRDAAQRGVKAALISPDRNLTRQVTAALDRWSLLPDDSAGRPLALSAPGRYLRQIAALFVEPITPDRLLALLKHPLTASNATRGLHLKLTRDLELRLRRHGPAFPTAADIFTWAETQKTSGAEDWAQAIAPALTALQDRASRPLADHVTRHRHLAETLARGTDVAGQSGLWDREAGRAALALMDELLAESPHGGAVTAGEYRNLFDSLLQKGELREPVLSHPMIMIWGTIEARVQGADLVILGGLNDTIWPRLPQPDPWLNRDMRKKAGLLLPERQIGLSAHDYQQAMGARQVVITRALRNAESETVPSRWLNRLMNLLEGLPDNNGPEALAQMRARGGQWVQWATAMDLPSAAMRADPALQPAHRPAPQPPVAARPAELPLTAIERLIRDPYDIYARYILRLRPLDPLRPQATALDRGIVVHRVLEQFVKDRPDGETRPQARARLMQLARDQLRQHIPFPAARALWLAKLDRAADHFLEQDQRHNGQAQIVESQGRHRVDGLNFALFGTPDRIDRLPNGDLHLIDYKTGAPPTLEQQKRFSKQLLLAAAMAERGGFETLGPSTVGLITYIGLGAGEKAVETTITAEILDQEWAKLVTLIGHYLRRDTGYTARRALFEQRFDRSYDHLSRFGEWQMSDHARPEPVGKDSA